jgi:NhaA family Na+:H+ antiporter
MDSNTIYRSPRPPLLQRILRPFQEFVNREASSGVLLLVCTFTALVWANSPWASSYTDVWHTPATIGIGPLVLSQSLLHWINDGLMAVFFFVVGLEIKREVLAGELATFRRAALPIAAAIGGMLVPAAIYGALNMGGEGAVGWGIPVATDIAFALGALALLGNRVPLSLKVFLTALAIVDDIGAVLVIALFYTAEISWLALVGGTLILGVLILANRVRVRDPRIYGILGVGLWLAFLESGVHATIAGVLLAMTIPAHSRINAGAFLDAGRQLLDEFGRAGTKNQGGWVSEEQQSALQALETACEQVETPLQRLEHALHPWVTFVIMPLFALANAGVSLQGDLMTVWTHPVSLGVLAGLVIGKQVGISIASWLAVKSRVASLPSGVTWQQVYGVSWLGGIGFTMSLFIASLAFGDNGLLTSAKLGILTASVIAGLVGYLLLARFSVKAIEPAEDNNDRSR